MIILTANIVIVANWIAETAGWIRRESLTGTALAVILALLVLLVSPKRTGGKAIGFTQRCSVCDKRLIGNPNYCTECGSTVS